MNINTKNWIPQFVQELNKPGLSNIVVRLVMYGFIMEFVKTRLLAVLVLIILIFFSYSNHILLLRPTSIINFTS